MTKCQVAKVVPDILSPSKAHASDRLASGMVLALGKGCAKLVG